MKRRILSEILILILLLSYPSITLANPKEEEVFTIVYGEIEIEETISFVDVKEFIEGAELDQAIESIIEEKEEAIPIGEDIIEYAKQFIGNPYVWGGNSLTNGIDCSHFVWQVLKNTGYYDGEYYTSAGWRSLGEKVSDLSDAIAGDVLCYDGHVAIYDGEGYIIEAKGSKYGITYDREATYGKILAIRRFTNED